jgi:hypothetical protein
MEHAVCGKCGWNEQGWGSVDDGPCPECGTPLIVWGCPEAPGGPDGCNCVADTTLLYRTHSCAEYGAIVRGEEPEP